MASSHTLACVADSKLRRCLDQGLAWFMNYPLIHPSRCAKLNVSETRSLPEGANAVCVVSASRRKDVTRSTLNGDLRSPSISTSLFKTALRIVHLLRALQDARCPEGSADVRPLE